jgi:hypothetical protein
MVNQIAALAGREPPVMMEAPRRSAVRPGRGEEGTLDRTMVKEARHR